MKVKFNSKDNEIPSLSPYVTTSRYERPKQVFMYALQEIEKRVDQNSRISLVDIGCANGEFLYYVKKSHPDWKLTGYDFMEEFIDVAKSYPGLKGVNFEAKNFFKVNKKFDVVCCFGTSQIFQDIRKPLKKLLDLCKEDGLLIVDGLFNKYDVDVINSYRDASKPESRDLWRTDFNQHSQKTVREFLNNKVKKIEFKEVPFNVDLPFDPDNPHINIFTFKDENGKRILTNGMNVILNPTLLMVNK